MDNSLEEILNRPKSTSACQILHDFPSDEKVMELIFRHRGGYSSNCQKCHNPATWIKATGRTNYFSACCRSELNPLEGTIFSKLSIPIRIWIYLYSLFCNRPVPLDQGFLAQHLGLPKYTIFQALVLMRNELQDELWNSFPGKSERWYVDEFQINVRKRLPRSDRKTFSLLGMSQGDSVYVIAAEGTLDGNGVYRKFLSLGVDRAEMFTSNLELYEQTSRAGMRIVPCEVGAFTRGRIIGDASARVNMFWPHFLHAMRQGRISPGARHIQRYVDEHAMRYNCRNDERKLFGIVFQRMRRFSHGNLQ